MPVERSRIELGEYENPAHVRVQAVADRDVYEPVLASDRHSWLGAKLR
jgi:hypothetical protein